MSSPDVKQPPGAKVIAITSGKGGVGKTFVSANVAAALAKRGLRVLVLDADLGLANLDVVLNLYPKITLHDVFTGKAKLEDAVIQAPGGFSVLLAGSGLVEYSRLTPEVRDDFLKVLHSLTPQFDVVILDTGAGISDVVLFAVSLASEVLVVATPEPTSLTDAYATIKLIATTTPAKPIGVVVNSAKDGAEADVVFRQLSRAAERFLQRQLRYDGYIVEDPAWRDSLIAQVPMVEREAANPASRCVRRLASRLASSRPLSAGPWPTRLSSTLAATAARSAEAPCA